MKILILGAGQVGGTLATHLASETLDITLVDLDEVRLRELRSRLDIRTVAGWASHPQVLREAGAEDADMLIAVTGSDEVNMVACQVSYSMFRTPAQDRPGALGRLRQRKVPVRRRAHAGGCVHQPRAGGDRQRPIALGKPRRPAGS